MTKRIIEAGERDELFHATLESIGDPVLIVADYRFVYVNPAAVCFYNAQHANDLIGMRVVDRIHPYYHNEVTERLNRLSEKRTQTQSHRETIHLKLDGRQAWVDARGTPITYKGLSAGLIFLQDVTEKKQTQEKLIESEVRYRTLFEHSHAVMLIVHPENGAIEDANPAAELFYGWNRDELLGMNISDINTLPPEEAKKIMSNAVDRKSNVFQFQHRRKDGSIRDVHVHSGPISIHGQRRLYSIIIDITDQLRFEQAIKDSLREKEVLLAEIHHRVKNNMAVISSLLQLEAEGARHRELQEILKKTDSRIKSMALVHEKLYRSETLSNIGFDHYVKELAEQIRSSYAHERCVELTFDLMPVRLDITQAVPCGIILNELVTNGFKYAYAPGKEGVIEIALKKQGEQVLLRYKDFGVGIGDAVMEKLSTDSLDSLGFELVRGLVRQLQGEVSFHNHDGTTIEITFPC